MAFPKGTTLDWGWEALAEEDIPAEIARDTEVDSDISEHAAIPDAHHAKYTDAEAQATVKANVEVGDLKVPTKALDMAGQKITGLATPVAGSDAATKDHVASVVQGLDWQQSVLGELAEPPVSPTDGDRYLVIATATGDWAGQENNIAEWNGISWDFTTPNTGFAVWIEDVGRQKVYNGTNWVSFGTTVDHGNLIGLGDDDHAQYLNNARHDLPARHTLGTVVPHDALASLTEKAHSSLTGIGASDHHAKTTSLGDITDHNLAAHGLGTIVPHDALASLTEKAHSSLTGVGPDDHHVKTGNYEVFGLTEEVASLPAAAAGNLGRFMRERTGAGQVTKICICVQNSADGHEWVQLGIST